MNDLCLVLLGNYYKTSSNKSSFYPASPSYLNSYIVFPSPNICREWEREREREREREQPPPQISYCRTSLHTHTHTQAYTHTHTQQPTLQIWDCRTSLPQILKSQWIRSLNLYMNKSTHIICVGVCVCVYTKKIVPRGLEKLGRRVFVVERNELRRRNPPA